MIALTSPLLWYTTRASGIVSLVMLTVVMVLGIMTATRVGGTTVPRFAVAEIHRRVALLAVVFLVIHITTTVLDTYVNVGIIGAVIPFASHYKTLWVALGTTAFDLLIAVAVTSLLRQRISHAAWRTVHWVSYLAWPIAVIHAIFMGTDLQFGWMDILVGVCIASVLSAGAWRLWAHPRPGGARTAVPDRRAARRLAGSTSGPSSPVIRRAPEADARSARTPVASTSNRRER